MTEAIAQVLPFAVGIMVSPIPIIAVILMLFTERARINGPLFLLGWVAGLAALAVVAYSVAHALGWGSGSTEDDAQVTFWRILLGLVLLVLAARKWRKAIDPDAVDELPPWMSRIDGMTPARALGTGVVLSALNPKNLALGLGAMTGLAALGAPTNEAAAGIIAFVVVASITVAAAVVYHAVGGARSQRTLDAARTWLASHNDAVMAVLLLVFGVLLVSQGLAG